MDCGFSAWQDVWSDSITYKIYKMKRSFFGTLTLIFIFLAGDSHGQSKSVGGEFAIGARLGNPIGATIKKYAGSNKSALEFIASWDFQDDGIEGFELGALWQKLAPLSGNGQLSAEFGLGPGIVFGDKTYFGALGILGFDWRLKAAPVTMSVDWMPSWFFVNENQFSFGQIAYSVRFILNHRKTKK